jgi:hypothetical protein
MLSPRSRVLTMACGLAVAALLLCAATSSAQCTSCAAPVYAAYSPVAVTAYQPVATCNSCAGYGAGYGVGYGVGYGTVTTYRPLLGGWTTRMVPYTAYRPVYASPVAYASYYAPAYASYYAPCASCASTVAYSPVVSYSPCNSCSTCSSCSPCNSCSPCVGSCGTTSSCSSCSAPTSYSNPTPASAPAATQRTFQSEKPATDESLTPKADTQLNSMPAPALQDPRDRVTSRPASVSPRVVLTAQRIQTSPVANDSGWQASKD